MTDKISDIIVKHMFPLNIRPPKYAESWIITCVDKIVSLEILATQNNYKYVGLAFIFNIFKNKIKVDWNMNDTIAAISTALGVGGISIIRVSGSESIEIVNKITKMKKILKASSHTISYDYIVDDEKIVDEVLNATVMKHRNITCRM